MKHRDPGFKLALYEDDFVVVLLFCCFVTLLPWVPATAPATARPGSAPGDRWWGEGQGPCAPSGEKISFHLGSIFARSFFSLKLRTLYCAGVDVLFNQVRSDAEQSGGRVGSARLGTRAAQLCSSYCC